MVTDEELLRQFRETRSEEAFGELTRRHVDLVYSVALRQVDYDEHLAKDVSQEVFCALVRKADSLGRPVVLGGWLCRTARFAARNLMRNAGRRIAREEEAQNMYEVDNSSDTQIDWESTRPILDKAISELGEKDRDAVWLRYFERKSFVEIGKHLGLNENSARMRVNRAIDKLNTLVRRRGITSTSTAVAAALAGQAAVAAPGGLAASLTHGAVASVAAGAGAVGIGTIIGIMNTTKIGLGIAAVITVAAVGTVVYQSQKLDQIQKELELAKAGEIERSVSVEPVVETVNAVEEKPIDPVAAEKEKQKQRQLNQIKAQLAWLADPEQRLDRFEQIFQAATMQLGELYEHIDLTPEEKKIAIGLQVQIQLLSDETGLRARILEGDAKEALLKSKDLKEKAFKQKIADVMGPDNYEKYQNYWNTLKYHRKTKKVQDALKLIESPISYEERTAIEGIYLKVDTENPYAIDLTAVNRSQQQELRKTLTQAHVDEYFNEREIHEMIILEEAAGMLSEEQVLEMGIIQASDRKAERQKWTHQVTELVRNRNK